MSEELESIRERMRDLIKTTCNTIGCKNCPNKWGKDEQGNSCTSDYLQMLEFEAERNNYVL